MHPVDDLLPLRAVARLATDLATHAELAAVGLDHARLQGEEVEVPFGTPDHAAAAFDAACRIARWLPELPVPSTVARPGVDTARARAASLASMLDAARTEDAWQPTAGLLGEMAALASAVVDDLAPVGN